jgi:hypothetical protein
MPLLLRKKLQNLCSLVRAITLKKGKYKLYPTFNKSSA